jgi:hypothetical protein
MLPPSVTESPVGLSLPGDLTDAAWTEFAQHYAARRRAASWALADLILHAERKSGDQYNWATQTAGIAYGTAANLASAARAFELSRRRESLSISHHVSVAALAVDDQDRLLDAAERERWTRIRLRQEVTALVGRRKPASRTVSVHVERAPSKPSTMVVQITRADAERSPLPVESRPTKASLIDTLAKLRAVDRDVPGIELLPEVIARLVRRIADLAPDQRVLH